MGGPCGARRDLHALVNQTLLNMKIVPDRKCNSAEILPIQTCRSVGFLVINITPFIWENELILSSGYLSSDGGMAHSKVISPRGSWLLPARLPG